jgi:thiol-disulfide isomerase/thioredoxin
MVLVQAFLFLFLCKMAALFKQSYIPYALFLVGVVFIFLWARSRKVEGFADATVGADAGAYKFVMYYADWCPHCHTAQPEFAKLGAIQTIGGKKVEIVAIEEKQIPESVKVSGFPTIRLMGPDGALLEEYAGDRKQAAFQAFLEQKLN